LDTLNVNPELCPEKKENVIILKMKNLQLKLY
jgi:hypothetical protein